MMDLTSLTMNSLHILQHERIEQVGEHRSPDGSLFAPLLLLKGEHTLTSLRQIVNNEIMQLAQNDFRLQGDTSTPNCRAIFVDAENMRPDFSFEDQQIDIAVTTNYSGRGGVYILDERERRDYYASCIHEHPGYITTAYGTLEGERPTIFASDEQELLELWQQSAPEIRAIVGDTCDHLFAAKTGSMYRRAANISMSLFSKFAGSLNKNAQHQLGLVEDALKRRLAAKVERRPKPGSVNIFQNVLHAAGPVLPPGTPEGALFVENRKARMS
jgi:hypothetical protein